MKIGRQDLADKLLGEDRQAGITSEKKIRKAGNTRFSLCFSRVWLTAALGNLSHLIPEQLYKSHHILFGGIP